MKFTANASDEWREFGNMAIAFAVRNGFDIEFSEIGDNECDGFTIKKRGGWRASEWLEFSELLHHLPGSYPDGEVFITTTPNDDGTLIYLWHD